MDLPSFFTAQPQVEQERLLLCLLLSEQNVQGLLVKISSQGVEVTAKSRVFSYDDAKQCVVRTDEALQDLGDESEQVNHIVFALDPEWVTGGEVIQDKQQLLEKISSDLSLEPIGFIVSTEALAHWLIKQKAHFSGFACILTGETLTMVGISQGKVVDAHQVGRSLEVRADFAEGLARFQSKFASGVLPGTLVLTSFELGPGEVREIQQDLIGSEWPEQVSFLQTPTIEVMSAEEYLSLLAQAAGKAAASFQGWLNEPSETVNRREAKLSASEMLDASSDLGGPEGPALQSAVPQPFDTGQNESEPLTAEMPNSAQFEKGALSHVSADESVATSFGIPIPQSAIKQQAEFEKELGQKLESSALDKEDQEISDKQRKKVKMKRLALVGFLAGLVALVLISVIWASAALKVEVLISLQDKALAKDVDITIDANRQQSDVEKLLLAAKTVSTTVIDEATVPTTGVKIVGESATGTVTIFNKTEADKTFSAGMVFKAGDFEFTLDEEVTVASASVKPKPGGEEKEFGKKEAKVTAKVIGAESNLPKETKFVVANYATSTYEAEAVSAMSGGSSREVRVVAEKDRTDVVAALREAMLIDAAQQLTDALAEGFYLVQTDTVLTSDAKFSADTGTEADELKVRLTLEVAGLSYNADDLLPIARQVLDSQIPEGYALVDEPPQIMSTPVSLAAMESKQQPIVLSANITSKSRRVLDDEAIKSELAGKSRTEAIAWLEKEEGVRSAELVFTPRLSSWLKKKLPASHSKITLRIVEADE
jgi:hypothetical protein